MNSGETPNTFNGSRERLLFTCLLLCVDFLDSGGNSYGMVGLNASNTVSEKQKLS